ncbi:MAG: gliding motility-associated C-terminal domain-containing protein, partial [Phaeodactylibacter sp.]|nr:gliding motility-associated C-terminal domain-containing protein [Phaeodactylibacter sp.]
PLNGNEPGLNVYLDMEQNGQGSSMTLLNQSSYGGIIDASAIGFTANTPYTIHHLDYAEIAIDLGGDLFSCAAAVPLAIPAGDYKSVQWSTGETGDAIEVSSSGTYSVTVETELCKFYSDTITIELDDYLEINQIYEFCENDTLFLHGQTFTEAGIYLDTSVSSSSACDTIFRMILRFAAPFPNFLGPDTTVCGSSYRLNSPSLQTTWGDGRIAATLEVTESGLYSASFVDDQGCLNRDTVQVQLQQQHHIYLPNAFSPNFDGINDCFGPLFSADLEFSSYRFSIYDRWGERLFDSRSPTDCWDGTFLGTALQPGVFVWLLETRQVNCPEEEVIKGLVELVN